MAPTRMWSAQLTATLVLSLFFFSNPASAFFRLPSPWGWECRNSTCVKTSTNSLRDLMQLSSCKLICGPHGSLWPKPSGLTTIGDKTMLFLPENAKLKSVTARSDQVEELLRSAFDIFKGNILKKTPTMGGQTFFMGPFSKRVVAHKLVVDITVSGSETRLTLNTSEAYTLSVTTVGPDNKGRGLEEFFQKGGTTMASILADTFFGARHALETLSQLIDYNEQLDTLEVVSTAAIVDSPAFPYRGILLDTSRNFYPVKDLERTLDAMAANKLNSFHWHIVDSHSFPLYLDSVPNMAFYGAYSSRKVYHPSDVRHLVEYARVRGIRIIPEFDAPAHAGNGWQWGEEQGLGRLAVCVNQQPWRTFCLEPPCGQLNIVNEHMYKILGTIYEEMADIFGPLDLFHFGGDEVNLHCYNTTEEITDWLAANNHSRESEDFYGLWNKFQSRAHDLFTTGNRGRRIPGIIWTSELTDSERIEEYLDKKSYIIQIWTNRTSPVITELLTKGYHVIFSNYDNLYLDCGFSAWVGEGNNWCTPYKGWQLVYDNNPYEIAMNLTGSKHENLILGGEAPLWSEQVDETALDARLWPRGSALAERLWTNPDHKWGPSETRMINQRERLFRLGISAERLQPEWCHQNEGQCFCKNWDKKIC